MRYFLAILAIVGQFLFAVNQGWGRKAAGMLPQGVQPTPVSNTNPGSVFTFSQLGYQEKIMVGPYDTTRILFSLPPTWQLTSAGTITLHYNFVGGQTIGTAGTINPASFAGGTLTVSFNNVVVDTIVLNQAGDSTAVISIPATALQPALQDGRYILSFFFDASVSCTYPSIQSTLVISSGSQLDLQHVVSSPPTDLTNFPRPLYQPQSVVPTQTTIVVPDQPTVSVIQAALAVEAGLGSLTNGELSTNLITSSQLVEDIRTSNNLIFVGPPSSFPILIGITALPIPIAQNRLNIAGANTNDGLVEMAVSPWNTGNVIVLVSGNTDDGILKAGQAIGTGHLITSGQSNVSIISAVNPNTNEGTIAEDRTLDDLGYGNQTLGDSFSGQYIADIFPASAEQASSTDGYLDITTSHSDLLNFDKSGVTVLLNGNVLGSIHFTQSSDQVTTTRMKLLPNMLHRGDNRLEFVSDLIPIYNCYSQSLTSSWVTISGSSLIHLPVSSQTIDLGKSLDLKNYPSILLTDRNLGDLAFIVPQSDSVAWNNAAQVAYYLGSKGSIPLANLQAAFANNVPTDMKNQQSLLIFGRATTLPIIADLKNSLPAPFPPNSDEATQPAMLVNYRLLPGVNVGYIELMTSPWNPERAVLAVMGNTEQGIPLAGQALINDTLITKLSGNFSILYGNQVLTTDTRLGIGTGQLIGTLPVAVTAAPTPVPTNTQPNQPQPQIKGRAGWILPAILVTTVIALLIAGFTLRSMFRGRVSKKELEAKDKETIA